jgi:hypothetical protein
LIWSDIETVYADPLAKSNGEFPACPICGETHTNWERLDSVTIEQVGLQHYMAHVSV